MISYLGVRALPWPSEYGNSFIMTIEPKEHHASIATLIVARPNLLEIHYHEGIVFDLKNVAEVQMLRRTIMGARAYATLTIIPESVDYRMETMQVDQGKPDRSESQILASAVVAKASMIELMTKLYLSYFPQLQRVLVTDDEAKARTWLETQLKEIALTGS